MEVTTFNFTSEQFNRLFPFYISIDKDINITETGFSINKLLGNIRGSNFNQHFSIVRPFKENVQIVDVENQLANFVIIETKTDNKFTLKGTFEKLGISNQFIFLGSIWVENYEALHQLELTQNDFSVFDNQIDYLNVISSKEIVNNDLQQIIKSVTHQKEALKKATALLDQTTKQLEASNLTFKYFTIATFDLIWDWDVITNEVIWGERVKEVLGFTQEELQNEPKFWSNKIHKIDREKIIESLENLLASDQNNWEVEYQFLTPHKGYIYLRDRGMVIRDENGKAIRMVGAVQDITQQKKEEQHLKLLESVITNAKDSVLITEAEPFDEPGPKIIYVNEAFCKMTGYTVEEVIGKTPRILQGPKSDKEALATLSKALRNWETCEITTINYKKNGEEFYINFSVTPVANSSGWFTHWIAIERDVTKEITQKDEIAQQKKFWEDILFNIPTDIAVFDKDQNYLFMNHHGIKDAKVREWLIGKNDFDFFKFRGKDNSIAKKRQLLFKEALQTKSVVSWVDEHIKADGEIEYKLRNFYPYYELDELKFVIGYGIDITERKKAEMHANNSLLQLKKSNEELEQFAYVASHDLQEPLRMVTSFLNLLSAKFNNDINPDAKKYIQFAVEGATRMQQIIADLLEFSKVGKTEDKIETIDLNDLLVNVISLQSRQIEEKKAIINIAQLPTIQTSKAPIRQVFQNLINNSLKYSKDTESPIVTINCTEEKLHWLFTLTDNGIGIDEQYYEKIFVIFQRLHSRDKFSGTGIGLAITKKIIENLGGTIWVKSVKGVGSEFYFTIKK